jgi:hypothetical protein
MKKQINEQKGVELLNPVDAHIVTIATKVFKALTPSLPELKTQKWLAKYLNTSEANVSRMRKEGLIESIEVSKGRVGYTDKAILEYLERKTKKATK